MLDTWINDRWCLKLPAHRHDRYSWPWWEATRLACMHHYLGQGGHVVYDIGAEEGDFPALWASWGNEVAMWEPNDRVWSNVKAIWQANDLPEPLLCFSGFAANSTTEGLLLDHGWPPSADGPVIGDHGFCNLSERPDIARVRLDDLPRLAAKRVREPFPPPTAISVDVEGAELEVLMGARETLLQHRPLVWVSVHPEFMQRMYGYPAELLHEYMDKLGYERTYLCTDHEEQWFLWPKERELFVQ